MIVRPKKLLVCEKNVVDFSCRGKKKFIRNECQNTEKKARLNFNNQMVLLAKHRYNIIITVKMLKIEFKFEYT